MPLRPLLPLFQLLFHLLPLFQPPPFLNDEIIAHCVLPERPDQAGRQLQTSRFGKN